MLEIITQDRVEFFVPGTPVAKGRPRLSHAHAFTPEKTRVYEGKVKCIASKVMQGRRQLNGPLGCKLSFRFHLPKSANKKVREAAEQGTIFRIAKPDLDNLIKAICDSCNGIVYEDDAEVAYLEAEKIYTTGEEGVYVTIDRL